MTAVSAVAGWVPVSASAPSTPPSTPPSPPGSGTSRALSWPAAPPRFAVPGMTDILDRDRILGAASPHGPDSLVNLYAAMPSLHVAWAAWCAAAVVAATRGRWRHLAWLYPAATTLVVIATANHFLADAAAGLAVTALGLLAARATTRPDATEPGPGGAGPAAASPALGPGAATRHRRPLIWWRPLASRWAWAVTGAAAVLIALRPQAPAWPPPPSGGRPAADRPDGAGPDRGPGPASRGSGRPRTVHSRQRQARSSGACYEP